MAFEQDLRVYLEGVALGHESPANTVLPSRSIDENELHRHFLDRLHQMESAGEAAAVRLMFEEWREKLARLARFVEALPRQIAPVDREGALAYACRALDQGIGCLPTDLSLVDRLELQRVVDEFVRGDSKVESYALENRLVRGDHARRAQLTELGRVFLRLRGKDAIRWLLTSEMVQSAGASDPWHASRDLLEGAVSVQGLAVVILDGEIYSEYNSLTLKRLGVLGVLPGSVGGPHGGSFQYRAEPAMRDVVTAVLDSGPWPTAIRALLDDERALVLPGTSSSSEATLEQTKLIAHEVRNALIPVRHDLEVLRSRALEPIEKQRIDRAQQGVGRVLEFVDAMVQMSELITEPATRCEIGAIVDEALGWIDTGQRVERLSFPGAVHLLAPRARLARAISNVVGNALQATTMDQPVRVSIVRKTGVVQVVVDDGGPGIPNEQRARIFLEGVTMRQDGSGSGFGLAFVRRVVEGALQGKVSCEDSDLGGARFVIELPEASPDDRTRKHPDR